MRLDGKQVRLAETERRLLEAERDRVTQLWVRGAWVRRAERALRDGAPFRPAAVLIADLDSFKRINDAYGHSAGDRVLGVVAGRLRDNLGVDGLIGRWGGDEFAALLRNVPSAHELAALQSAVKQPIRLGDLVLNVALSVGVGEANEGASLDAMLRSADGALYEAKGRVHGGSTELRAVDRASLSDVGDAAACGPDPA